MPQRELTPLEALYRLGHTICMNSNEGNIKWNLDPEDDYPEGGYDPIDTDCKSTEDAVACLNIIEDGINKYEDELRAFKLAYEWKCNGVEGTYEEVLERAKESIAGWKEIEAKGYGEVIDE